MPKKHKRHRLSKGFAQIPQQSKKPEPVKVVQQASQAVTTLPPAPDTVKRQSKLRAFIEKEPILFFGSCIAAVALLIAFVNYATPEYVKYPFKIESIEPFDNQTRLWYEAGENSLTLSNSEAANFAVGDYCWLVERSQFWYKTYKVVKEE